MREARLVGLVSLLAGDSQPLAALFPRFKFQPATRHATTRAIQEARTTRDRSVDRPTNRRQKRSTSTMVRPCNATAVVVALAACLLFCAATTTASAAGGGATIIYGDLRAASAPSCDGTLGQCAVRAEEEEEVGGGGLRRSMAQRQPTNRYISYAALKADQVPCNQRGKSYYTNCASQQKANPYRRGCSAITRCQRNTN